MFSIARWISVSLKIVKCVLFLVEVVLLVVGVVMTREDIFGRRYLIVEYSVIGQITRVIGTLVGLLKV